MAEEPAARTHLGWMCKHGRTAYILEDWRLLTVYSARRRASTLRESVQRIDGLGDHGVLVRAYCLSRRRLLGEIARVAARAVTTAIRTLTGERDLAIGIVARLQTHGSRANWHPHLHLLLTDGGFRPDGTFVSWPAHDTARLTEPFRRAMLRRFVRLELFDEDQAASMLT